MAAIEETQQRTVDEVVARLRELATLLTLRGESTFRVRAYENGAIALTALTEELGGLIGGGRLIDVPGIGTGLAEKIEAIWRTGTCPLLEELRQELPASLVDLLRVPGLGPKRVLQLYKTLGISSVAELEAACRGGRLGELRGFGAKSQEKLLAGIASLQTWRGKVLFSTALETAQGLLRDLERLPGVSRASVAGSLRRRKEVVQDVDILVAAPDPVPVFDALCARSDVRSVLGRGDTKCSVVLDAGLQIDVRTVTAEQFPFALHYFTGSKEHNTALRGRAKARGLKLNEYGLWREADDTGVPCKDEAALFRALDLDYIPPELRENMGELEAAAESRLPELLREGDVRGVFHVHTTYSDGAASVEEMVATAAELGFEYVGISDHSRSAGYAGGLTAERLRTQRAELEGVRARHPEIVVFHGVESDILADGRLDYDDEVLAQLDFVIGSIHSALEMPEAQMTQRVLRALSNPYLTVLGHPTNRLLLTRDGVRMDMLAVIQAAADHGVAVELNASPHRLDLDWRYGPYLKEKKALVCINPDAHTPRALSNVAYGVGTARKAWLGRADVLNTRSAAEMRAYLDTRRAAA